MYWYGSGMSGWGVAAMAVGQVAFWALLLGVVVLVVRRATQGSPPSPPSTPEDVLAMRLARGEIDQDEYERRMATLRARSEVGRL